MKWRTKRNRDPWYMGPEEGLVIYYAKKGGVTFEVQASYRDRLRSSGPVCWWLTGVFPATVWPTREAAMLEAVRIAKLGEDAP